MTDLYRKNGISVILDVVYNHTGEGDANGPDAEPDGARRARPITASSRSTGKQHLVNDTGTGNTLRCDHPATQRLVIESLRYWVRGDWASPASASISRRCSGASRGSIPMRRCCR